MTDEQPSTADERRSSAGPSEAPGKALSKTSITWGSIIVGLIAGVAVTLLLIFFGSGSKPDAARLDAIRTAGAIVIGFGGAIALFLTARRQRYVELDVIQKDLQLQHQRHIDQEESEHRERVAAATELDAAERRITELYTNAAEQLGSEKAPVRLAGLYALERLAQDTSTQRQTIVNVICAYLRMPYTSPGERPPEDAPDDVHKGYTFAVQEREVRITAQRVLATHLLPGRQQENEIVSTGFWPEMEVDLTSATLIDFTLRNCVMNRAVFRRARFEGNANFDGALFKTSANFSRAHFLDAASFTRSSFKWNATFEGAIFEGSARFGITTFSQLASFSDAEFHGPTNFARARFLEASFDGARFSSAADFNHTNVTFDGSFKGVVFANGCIFSSAHFGGSASFDNAEFGAASTFERATFASDVSFAGAEASRCTMWCWANDDANVDRNWPSGWEMTLQPDSAQPPGRDGVWHWVWRQ